MKTVLIDGKIVVFYEVWTKTSYVTTSYFIIKGDGHSSEPVDLKMKLRFQKSDDLFLSNDRRSAIAYAGEKGKIINRYEIKLI